MGMLLALITAYLLVAVAFFGALAFAARQPIPAIEASELLEESRQDALGGFWRGAPRRQVLAVDDDPAILELLAELVKEVGYEVQAVTSGAEALQKLGQSRFDMVLTDLQMPNMSGEELANEIERTRPGLPVVFVSGKVSPGPTARHPFLAKPFSLSELEQTLAMAC
jgi:CheY-like chemotaxis protein